MKCLVCENDSGVGDICWKCAAKALLDERDRWRDACRKFALLRRAQVCEKLDDEIHAGAQIEAATTAMIAGDLKALEEAVE